jgi:hypothetical protein
MVHYIAYVAAISPEHALRLTRTRRATKLAAMADLRKRTVGFGVYCIEVGEYLELVLKVY